MRHFERELDQLKAKLLEMSALVENPTNVLGSADKVQRILQNDPDYIPALMVAGLIAEQKSDAQGAQKIYERIVARCPDFTPAKKRLAALAAKKAEPKK